MLLLDGHEPNIALETRRKWRLRWYALKRRGIILISLEHRRLPIKAWSIFPGAAATAVSADKFWVIV